MAVLVVCASCQKTLRVRDELRGSHIACPHCHHEITAEGEHVPNHDVFISYAQKNKHVADEICAALEGRGVRGWIAPRDIPPGANWGASIVKAIKDSRMMVLVFASSPSRSQYVLREVNAAVAAGAVQC
ncbi:MAG: toll/interleukin-1 receptor domain-containing protein [Candidatus Hydrogenedentes bacterium]|nr:toll/interleukin-1 receptor domain-containing protein [Candidatus Hydrogenedentota bacterium]